MSIVKLQIDKYLYPVNIEATTYNRLKVTFPFNRAVINEIKAMSGAKWHGYDKDQDGNINGNNKFWTIANDNHNKFRLAFMRRHETGVDPYDTYNYNAPLVSFSPKRKLYEYQVEATSFLVTRKRCILAMEPGLGKTLCVIEALEYLGIYDNILWVGPRSGLIAVRYEMQKWKSNLRVDYITYDSLRKVVEEAKSKYVAIIYDESQRIKDPASLRSNASATIADAVRNKDGIIYLLTGTPSPNSAYDWWNQCRVACPGFLREGSLKAFKNRLSIIEYEDSPAGGRYPSKPIFFDNPLKCKVCGKFKDDYVHEKRGIAFENIGDSDSDSNYHQWEQSTNEVELLYKRMKGLVLVRFKKDCLSELPEKIYRKINITPSKSILRAASLITKTAESTIKALILTRELSDGFQYSIGEKEKEETCELCHGTKILDMPEYTGPEDLLPHERLEERYWKYEKQLCHVCNGAGVVNRKERIVNNVHSPKEDVIKDLLEEYEDVGRVVIYAAFTGTIDKLTDLVTKSGWKFIRVDGRGWHSNVLEHINIYKKANQDELYRVFQEDKELFPKVAFVAHPESGGVALTLTASPVAIFYSNDFRGESRMQAVERIHRPGMDINKGATIIDLIHLPTDQLILDNLERKIKMQAVTMGDLERTLNNINNGNDNEQGIRYF